MSFPPGTEMFHFPGFAFHSYEFRVKYLIQKLETRTRPMAKPPDETNSSFRGGFPHSEIRGSKAARASPQLIAACHVLHRLSVPRHPLNALKTLDCLMSIRGDESANAPCTGTDACCCARQSSSSPSKHLGRCRANPPSRF